MDEAPEVGPVDDASEADCDGDAEAGADAGVGASAAAPPDEVASDSGASGAATSGMLDCDAASAAVGRASETGGELAVADGPPTEARDCARAAGAAI